MNKLLGPLENDDAGRRLKQGVAAKGKGPNVYRRVLRKKLQLVFAPQGGARKAVIGRRYVCM